MYVLIRDRFEGGVTGGWVSDGFPKIQSVGIKFKTIVMLKNINLDRYVDYEDESYSVHIALPQMSEYWPSELNCYCEGFNSLNFLKMLLTQH